MKTLYFTTHGMMPILYTTIRISKVLESVCLFLTHVRPAATQPLKGEGLQVFMVRGDEPAMKNDTVKLTFFILRRAPLVNPP
jgi:hypothetical protein